MSNEIVRQKEMLIKLNSELDTFRSMLIGSFPVEENGDVKEDCLTDIVKINTIHIEEALKTMECIKEIMGGK